MCCKGPGSCWKGGGCGGPRLGSLGLRWKSHAPRTAGSPLSLPRALTFPLRSLPRRVDEPGGTTLMELGPKLPEFGPSLADVLGVDSGPNLTDFGPMWPSSGQVWSILGPLGRSWSKPGGRCRSDPPRTRRSHAGRAGFLSHVHTTSVVKCTHDSAYRVTDENRAASARVKHKKRQGGDAPGHSPTPLRGCAASDHRSADRLDACPGMAISGSGHSAGVARRGATARECRHGNLGGGAACGPGSGECPYGTLVSGVGQQQ